MQSAADSGNGEALRRRTNFYSGEDGYVHFLMSAGGLGVISVVSNIAPRYMSDMVKAYLNGEIEKSWKMQVACQDLVKALFCEVNPIPVKEAHLI